MKIISYYPVDRITALPQPILEIILCLVPIKDAVRTSILSRSWRYNWTTISKLVFNDTEMLDRRKTYIPNIFPPIHQVLSMYKGPAVDFSLTLRPRGSLTEEIDRIITYLSKNNTVKKFTLVFGWHSTRFSLPSSFYSLYRLTDLYLRDCDFYPIPKLKGGFPCLKNLQVEASRPSGKSLVHLLSISPVLKSFNLMGIYDSCCSSFDDNVSMFEICKNLSLIENMSLCMLPFQEVEAPPELPSALVHLKYLCLDKMLSRRLHSLVLLIRISPNLEKIKLQLCEEIQSVTVQVDYSRILLKHLREMEITNCSDDIEYQLEFMKFILAKSPALKKVSIAFHNKVFVHTVEGIETMRILLQSPCASPDAEINFEHPIYDLVGFKSLYTSI